MAITKTKLPIINTANRRGQPLIHVEHPGGKLMAFPARSGDKIGMTRTFNYDSVTHELEITDE